MRDPAAALPPPHIATGSPAFARVTLAMIAAGFSTFALMNAVQPLMPLFGQDFGVSATTASLSLSLNIGALALAMLLAAPISDRFGRKPVMAVSLILSSLLMLVSALVESWQGFLWLRMLQGISFAGVPAVALSYLAEEIEPADAATAVGIYISGAALGGMGGRLIAGPLAAVGGWPLAMAGVGAVGLISAAVFAAALPASRHFQPRAPSRRLLVDSYLRQLRPVRQLRLYAAGFLLMGSLVSVYNYLPHRLMAAPYLLSPAVVGLLFLTYVSGMASAPLSGRLSARLGRRRVAQLAVLVALAGLACTAAQPLLLVMAGLVAFTVGFFAAHAIASGRATERAGTDRAYAATLYLLAYYLGGALIGWASGPVWETFGWVGLATLLAGLMVLALAALGLD